MTNVSILSMLLFVSDNHGTKWHYGFIVYDSITAFSISNVMQLLSGAIHNHEYISIYMQCIFERL